MAINNNVPAALKTMARTNAVGCAEKEIVGGPLEEGRKVLPVTTPTKKPAAQTKLPITTSAIAIRLRTRIHATGSYKEVVCLLWKRRLTGKTSNRLVRNPAPVSGRGF